jgi:hypothetical protein
MQRYSRLKNFILGITILFSFSLALNLSTQSDVQIPYDRILQDNELIEFLRDDIPALTSVSLEKSKGNNEKVLQLLAEYFKEKVSERYYFDWKKFQERFQDYQVIYPDMREEHFELADYQMTHFPAETSWKLPFRNLLGEEVTAYQLRHLARQQKSLDMALVFFYSNEEDKYLDYFVRQVGDLNRAFSQNQYDDVGNAVYEVFRAGKRIHYWLYCYHVYLNNQKFDWKKQILLIKTFLHHGAQLYQRTKKFRYGNHHTRGLVALFEISTLFSEFKGCIEWQKQALEGLDWHLKREVNSDGFQFERSVHYHKGDIENYLRVYQLARRNNILLSDFYQSQFYKLFEALVRLAQPNRRLPVLQDDTDKPFQEYNDIDDVMMAGAIIFESGLFKYFTNNRMAPNFYWFFNEDELNSVSNINVEIPQLGSTALPETGYYIMRNGWDFNDYQMVISAGLSEKKPDHQHGEMLSLTAYANGTEILPNYQVKYNYPDLAFWKNSWVKNVALVDSIPLGRGWIPNKGGSGFGKWMHLPKPKVICWINEDKFDYFAGTHDSYDSFGINYYREVIFIKDGFWIVRDHFNSTDPHNYQQIWQGIYQTEQPGLARSVMPNNFQLEIQQLSDDSFYILTGQYNGKGAVLFEIPGRRNFVFTTLLQSCHPEGHKSRMIGKEIRVKDWQVYGKSGSGETVLNAYSTDAKYIAESPTGSLMLYDLSTFQKFGIKVELEDTKGLFIDSNNDLWEVWYLGLQKNEVIVRSDKDIKVSCQNISLQNGKKFSIEPGVKFQIQYVN